MNIEQLGKLTNTQKHWFRYWMPYVFQKLEHANRKHFYIPLNRDYKPLGVVTRKRVDYKEYALSHGVFFAMNPRNIENVWIKDLYLYEDSPTSRVDYFKRFEQLMSYAIEVDATLIGAESPPK